MEAFWWHTYLYDRGHHEKQSILNNILLLFIGLWPRKPQLSYTGALVWSTLLCLHPFPKRHVWVLSKFLDVRIKEWKGQQRLIEMISIEKFDRLLQPWCEFPPWMWTVVPPDKSHLSPETITSHHDAFAMKGINQQSTPWNEDPHHVLAQHKDRWPSERPGATVVPVRNPMARSRSSANGSVWVWVWTSHTISGPQSRKTNDWKRHRCRKGPPWCPHFVDQCQRG